MTSVVVLNETETRALAMRRVLWAPTNHDEWLEWEDGNERQWCEDDVADSYEDDPEDGAE